MAIANLTIDLNAKLASFEQNLSRSVGIAQANANKLERAFAGVSNTLKGLGAGIGIAVIANIAKSAITSAAALHDFSEQTGATVENLSKLEQVAALSGTGIETVVEAIQKLAVNLGKTDDEGKGAARALKAIGLEASKLRSIDPAEAFKQVALAFDKYADSGTKVAVANALIRGDGPRLLGFMKDLAEAGDVAAVVSGKQAAEADKLTKQLAALGQQFKNTASVATFEFLDALKEIDDQLRIGIETFGGFYTALARIGLSSPFSDAEEQIDSLTGKIAAAKQDQIDNPLFSKFAFADTNIAALEQELSYYEKIVAAKRDRNKEDLPGLGKPDIEFKPSSPDGKAARPGKPDNYFDNVFDDSIKALQKFSDEYHEKIIGMLARTDTGKVEVLAEQLRLISTALEAGEVS